MLPLLEGSTVTTKHGNVNTDQILFIASGAFHQCKPSDMLAELQGRLPIKVELKGLTRDDLLRILTEPEANVLKQQRALLETEGVELSFTDEAVRHVANLSAEVNRTVDNIGARRLHTVLDGSTGAVQPMEFVSILRTCFPQFAQRGRSAATGGAFGCGALKSRIGGRRGR